MSINIYTLFIFKPAQAGFVCIAATLVVGLESPEELHQEAIAKLLKRQSHDESEPK